MCGEGWSGDRQSRIILNLAADLWVRGELTTAKDAIAGVSKMELHEILANGAQHTSPALVVATTLIRAQEWGLLGHRLPELSNEQPALVDWSILHVEQQYRQNRSLSGSDIALVLKAADSSAPITAIAAEYLEQHLRLLQRNSHLDSDRVKESLSKLQTRNYALSFGGFATPYVNWLNDDIGDPFLVEE